MAGQVGRISGGVLTDNLLRNGIDLNFKDTSVDTALLQLKVNSSRIGVNTENPSADLEVVDTIGTTTLIQPNYINVANFTIQNSEINVAPGNMYVNAANNIKLSNLQTDDINVNNNSISTTLTDSNLEIRPNGTGDVNIYSNTNITGSLHATGNITFGGNLVIGDDNNDSLDFNSDINSSLIPDLTDTYDLGSDPKRWGNIYTNTVKGNLLSTNTIVIDGTTLDRRPGNTFFVAVNGNDSNVGDHPQGPFRTIAHALAVADASTAGPVTIHIYPGEYEEELPLVVPANTTITGEDIRNTIIKPNISSQGKDVFHLNQNTIVENITIKDFTFDSVSNTGYALRYAPDAIMNDRSPYARNITVITNNNNGIAGKGAWIDGSEINSASTQASFLFHSVTFITPGVDCITMTNGVRVEWLNSFTYFANRGLYAIQGSTGFVKGASTASVITGGSPGESWAAPRTLVVGGILNNKNFYIYGDERIEWTGTFWKYYNTTIGSEAYYQSLDNTDYPWEATTWLSVGLALPVPTFSAEGIIFGAEIRSIGSANVYGNYGAVADGPDTLMYLISHNFAYIGSGLDSSNDKTFTLQDQEAIELNNGKIYYVSIDEAGTFRVGDVFFVDFDKGTTSIDASSIDFTGISSLIVTSGTSITYIDGSRINIGNIRLSGNTLETLTGDLIWSPATGFLDVTNNLGFIIPKGPTEQRKLEAADVRYNTTINAYEGYSSTNVSFNGVYSENRATRITGNTVSNDVVFTVNNAEVGRLTSGTFKITGYTTSNILVQNSLITTTLNSDLIFNPDGAGAVVLDDLKIYDNIIENTANTNFTIAGTNRGYLKFDSTTGLVIPTGVDIDRPVTPETGMTRWNTERDYLETWNGITWQRSAGEGEVVTSEIMGELLDIYTLVLG